MEIQKYFDWLHGEARIPRKLKKKMLGKRLSKSKLSRMLKETIIGEPIRTMFERVKFKPHGAFCPKCGCKYYFGSGNMTVYPEHWEEFRCLRCGEIVGYIDNSPFVHALECAPSYDPTF